MGWENCELFEPQGLNRSTVSFVYFVFLVRFDGFRLGFVIVYQKPNVCNLHNLKRTFANDESTMRDFERGKKR